MVNEDLNNGCIGDEINFEIVKKLIDNTHKQASYSTSINMKVASKIRDKEILALKINLMPLVNDLEGGDEITSPLFWICEEITVLGLS